MTLRYSDINQHDALYTVARAYPGGIEALGARLGKSGEVLRKKLRPDAHTNYMSFEEMSLVVELAEGARVPHAKLPIEALCWRHGMVAIPLPALPNDELPNTDLYEALCNVLAEMGDVSRALSSALADNHLSKAEFDELDKEFEEAVSAAMVLRKMVKARAEQDSKRAVPRGLRAYG